MLNTLNIDALEASQEFKEYLELNPHFTSSRVVMIAFDDNSGAMRKVTNTSVYQAEKMLDLNRSEESRDETKNYWDCFDTSTQSFVRGYVSHFKHGDDVKYTIQFIEDPQEAEELKKTFLPRVKKAVRVPPFTPEMIKVFNGEDFDVDKLRAEAEKFKTYKAMALKGGK